MGCELRPGPTNHNIQNLDRLDEGSYEKKR
jgi:hypothetical protein